ncbi:MAG TPA: nucleoside-diphosphate kinase [Phycisphaerae bacterium]|nr:nucleoside-diphosphate kinase [Phycisphaerae bacterium]HUT60535.1 nucleoside-diphosphate kinase [Phycisphaerae bacterium]
MEEQLAYALITPYSLYKSRTGGIIGRLLAYARLEFVAARMYVFSDALVDAYQKIICPPGTPAAVEKAWHEYIDESLRQKNPWGYLPRCMLLLFRGPDAVRHLKEDVIGAFTEQPVGDTIRGTYGDFIRDEGGVVRYFQPAVITCPDPKLNDKHLKLLADYALSDGGVLTGRIEYDQPNVQTSLVLIKPDNFERRSHRPGNIIDTFSLTGLRIVAAKLFNMTVAQGEEFYGPLKALFVEKLKGNVTQEVYRRLQGTFSFAFTMADAEAVAERLAERNAVAEFNRIVEYMTGVNPEDVTDPEERAAASRAKCLALLYEGPDALDKIRTVLGSTDPTKAEPGTVRSDFGRDLMRNGAHASDSPESADRERGIVSLTETEKDTCDVVQVVHRYLERRK